MKSPGSLLLFLAFSAAAHATPPPCAALRHTAIPATAIALPTRGAVVDSAREAGGFCRILGRILSVDPHADPIRFELNLPDHWNQKALQFGGGAFDGYLHESDALGPTVVGDRRGPTPLAQGYATFGSDSGHHHHYLLLPDALNAVKANFALNEEQRLNFASESVKKTHDTVIALMMTHYAAAPRRMYFIGGSTGGREAMMAVDRWPADYDGVLAAYAAWNQIESDLQFIRVSQAMYAPGGWLPKAKTTLLHNAALNACDAADGLRDGIISDPESCRFDAATLRCADGADHKACLSDAQERTVAAFATATVSAYAVTNGMMSEPGFNVLRGTDLTGSMGLVSHAFHPPNIVFNSFYSVVADGVLRFFLTQEKHFNALTFDWQHGGENGRWLAGIRKQSAEDDASLADLTPFAAHGGKLLLLHGTADATIPTEASVLLYTRIVAAMGQARADDFLRLYLIPGFAHGSGSFYAGMDTIGVLDRWADGGVAPSHLIVTDQNKGAARSRPLCAWPAWPRYTGGDAANPDSFTCRLRTAQPPGLANDAVPHS